MTELTTPVPRKVITSPDTQTAIWFLGALSQVRVSGEQTGGAFALADNLARRGNASPVHVHDRADETFFVLDGELRVMVGEGDYAAGPGTVAALPRRLRRAYVVTSATARFLTLHTPGGFESAVGDLGDEGIEVVDEDGVHGVAGMLGPLLDDQIPNAGGRMPRPPPLDPRTNRGADRLASTPRTGEDGDR
jgi:mannose-6-phosphate isomerase-like protein (cupin superfamily)